MNIKDVLRDPETILCDNYCTWCETELKDNSVEDELICTLHKNQFDNWVVVSYHEKCYLDHENMFKFLVENTE